MWLSDLVFVGCVFHSLVSVALSGFQGSVVTVGSPLEGASAGQWMAARNRDWLGENAKRSCGNEVEAPVLAKRQSPRGLGVWWEKGKGFLLVGCSRKKTISGETGRKELGGSWV